MQYPIEINVLDIWQCGYILHSSSTQSTSTLKGNDMKQVMTIKEEKTSLTQILGSLMIGFAVIDFALSYAGINLTSFLGSASRFSPIIG